MKRRIEVTEIPVACTLDTTAFEGRMNEFDALFRAALVAKGETADGIRFRFANRDGIESQIRDLAARELACCSFFRFTITAEGDEVWWDSTVDNPEAQPILEDFLALPERLATKERDS
jgi:hypothetical protein